MPESQVAKNPELRQAALMCDFKLPCDVEVDMKSVEEKIRKVRSIIDTNDRSVLESSLEALEKIKALKNKFNVVD